MEKLNEGGEGSGRYPKGSGRSFPKSAASEYRKTVAGHIKALRRSYGSSYQGRFSGAHKSTANWIRKQYKDAKIELPRGLKKYFRKKYESIQNEGGEGSGRYPKGSGSDKSNVQQKTKSWQELQKELDKIQRYTEPWFVKRQEFSGAYRKAHGDKSEMEINNMGNIGEACSKGVGAEIKKIAGATGSYPLAVWKAKKKYGSKAVSKALSKSKKESIEDIKDCADQLITMYEGGPGSGRYPKGSGKERSNGSVVFIDLGKGKKLKTYSMHGGRSKNLYTSPGYRGPKKLPAHTGTYAQIYKRHQLWKKAQHESVDEGGPGSGRYPAGSGDRPGSPEDRKTTAGMIRYARRSGGRTAKIAGRSKRLSKDYQKQWMKFQIDMQKGPRQPGS